MKKMKTHSRYQDNLDSDSKSKRSCFCGIVPAVSLLCVVLLFSTLFFAQRYNEKLLRWKMNIKKLKNDNCKNQCRTGGSHALPEGIISNTSDLEMRHLWDLPMTKTIENKENASTNLFAMAVGIKQKDLVNKLVKKFLSSNFVVMLFHYDGIVDEWNDFEWNNHVIHVAVANQSKWWFAKRFLHPDIVAEYGYIFLWDEDLGVEHFHPDRYVSIIKSEGLEISQPALDSNKSEGDRTKNVGVVDAEYIVHYGHPTLGGLDVNEVSSRTKDHRVDVRRLSYRELQVFRKRWQKAVEEDDCWVDPFQ
ncbi:hypothetical protein GmHk_18G053106 [Glycine max]|nr:hypothetical protein GmHk_18G053106 [Glycine max]